MNGSTKKILKQAARSLAFRFEVVANSELVRYDSEIKEHHELLAEQRAADPFLKIDPPRYVRRTTKKFQAVNHFTRLKKIYNSVAKRDVQTTIEIYFREDQIKRKQFEKEFPGKYNKLMDELRRNIMVESQKAQTA